MAHAHVDAAALAIVFDAVFDEIEQDLIGVVLKREDGAALFHAGGQLDGLAVGQRDEHTEHARECPPHVHDLVLAAPPSRRPRPRLSVRSFCAMRVRRSDSAPMSATNSRIVSASISFCRMESDSSLMEASGA